MRTRIEWTWERLDDNTHRAKVFGGWVVKHYSYVETEKKNVVNCCESMVYVNDTDHRWHILQPLKESEKTPSIAQDF